MDDQRTSESRGARDDEPGPGPASERADIPAVVRGRRKQLGLTQQDLADLAGASDRFVRDFENGKPSVRLDKVLDVLNVLGLEPVLRLRRPDAQS